MQRRNFMLKTTAALAFGGLALAGCTTTGTDSNKSTSSTNESKRQSIDASVDGTMSRLFTTVKGSRELVSKARGVLVFPSVLQAGFIVGGQYGEGALRVGGSIGRLLQHDFRLVRPAGRRAVEGASSSCS